MFSFILGFTFIILAMSLWIFIQNRWKAAFSEEYNEEDALAHRSDCHSCGNCSKQCKTKSH